MFIDQKTILLKLAVLLQLICRFSRISMKISAIFLAEIDKLILKFIWKYKGPKIVKIILKKNKIGGFTLPNRNKPLLYGQLIFNRDAKTVVKEQTFQQTMLGQVDVHMQKNEVGSLTYTMYKNGLRRNMVTHPGENFLTSDLAVSSWISHQKHRQQKQKQMNGTTPNFKSLVHQRTQSTQRKDSL